MREVHLYGKLAAGRVALVDDEDFDLVSQHRWNCSGPAPYARTQVPTFPGDERFKPRSGRSSGSGQIGLFMHVLIMGHTGVDHINHNGLDNQRSNLRPATTAQNNHNQRPQRGTSSRYKGVTWHRRARKWQALIQVDGKGRFLGYFASEEEAAFAYDTAACETWGERAYLNGGPPWPA